MGGMRYQPQRQTRTNPRLGIRFLINAAFGARDLAGSAAYESLSGGSASQIGAPRGIARQYIGATDYFGEQIPLPPTAGYSVIMVVDVPTMKDWAGLFARYLYGGNGFKLLQQEGGGPNLRITEHGQSGSVASAYPGAGAKLYGAGPVCVVVVWDGQSAHLHINGERCGDAPLTISPNNGNGDVAQLRVMGISDVTGITGKMYLTAYAPNVAWSREQARHLSASPWRIFDENDDEEAAASVATDTALVGMAAVVASTSGALSNSIRLAGTGIATAAGSGALATIIRLTGAAPAQAGAAGALSTAVPLVGTAQASAAGAGALTTSIGLAGIASAVAGAAGALAGANAAAVLAGTATANASGTGALATRISLAGGAFAQASATGSPATRVALVGAALSVASATGVLSAGGRRPVGINATDVSPARTVKFAGGTRVVRFEGGTHSVKFQGGTHVVKFDGTGSKIVRF